MLLTYRHMEIKKIVFLKVFWKDVNKHTFSIETDARGLERWLSG